MAKNKQKSSKLGKVPLIIIGHINRNKLGISEKIWP